MIFVYFFLYLQNFGDVSPTTLSPEQSPSNSCDEGENARLVLKLCKNQILKLRVCRRMSC